MTVSPPSSPIDPSDLIFEFTYSTGNADGGSSVLLYSKSTTIETMSMSGIGSMSVTKTETLTANGTFSYTAGFGFNVTDGITVSVQSSGSGATEYKSASVSVSEPPDVSQPTDWWGSWHYPEMRHEFTVRTSSALNADVTLMFGFTGDVSIYATYSAQTEVEAKSLGRTDWVYWETESDGTNTYLERGYVETTDTSTYRFDGNETDGFDESITSNWHFEGDALHFGTKHVGPPPTPPTDQDESNTENFLDGVQLALDIGGLIPGLGEVLDGINVAISLARGNYGEATLSIAAMNPLGGQAVTGAKLANKAGNAIAKNLDKADEAANALVGLSDELSDAVRQAQSQQQNMAKIDLPLGKGSTANLSKGTTLPRNLREQLAVEQVIANPTIGLTIKTPMADTKNGWLASDGWVKMQQIINPGGGEGPINVHYVFNKLTNQIDDLKIVVQGVR